MLNAAEHAGQRQAEVDEADRRVTRFAIYFTPRPGSALSNFGRSWFGRTNDGSTLKTFSASGMSPVARAEAALLPYRYLGLNAPFFSPLTLQDGVSLTEVSARLETFAAHRKPIETGPLVLARAGRVLLLRPANPCPELDWLALQSFNTFDAFAVPVDASDDDYPHLSAYQRLLLKSFGQPNVMSEYRFALKLTGTLSSAHLERIAKAITPLIEETCAEGIKVDGLSLVGTRTRETTGGGAPAPMRLLARYPLGD